MNIVHVERNLKHKRHISKIEIYFEPGGDACMHWTLCDAGGEVDGGRASSLLHDFIAAPQNEHHLPT